MCSPMRKVRVPLSDSAGLYCYVSELRSGGGFWPLAALTGASFTGGSRGGMELRASGSAAAWSFVLAVWGSGHLLRGHAVAIVRRVRVGAGFSRRS